MAASMRVSGTSGTSRRLRELAKRAENPAPALDKLPAIFEEHVTQTFETKGSSDGRQWQPLSKPYAARKKAGSGLGPLVLSGSLRDSFFGGKWHIERTGSRSITWGSRHPLAHLHQNGTKGRRIPARRMLVVTKELRRQTRHEFRDYLLKLR